MRVATLDYVGEPVTPNEWCAQKVVFSLDPSCKGLSLIPMIDQGAMQFLDFSMSVTGIDCSLWLRPQAFDASCQIVDLNVLYEFRCGIVKYKEGQTFTQFDPFNGDSTVDENRTWIHRWHKIWDPQLRVTQLVGPAPGCDPPSGSAGPWFEGADNVGNINQGATAQVTITEPSPVHLAMKTKRAIRMKGDDRLGFVFAWSDPFGGGTTLPFSVDLFGKVELRISKL